MVINENFRTDPKHLTVLTEHIVGRSLGRRIRCTVDLRSTEVLYGARTVRRMAIVSCIMQHSINQKIYGKRDRSLIKGFYVPIQYQ